MARSFSQPVFLSLLPDFLFCIFTVNIFYPASVYYCAITSQSVHISFSSPNPELESKPGKTVFHFYAKYVSKKVQNSFSALT